MKPRGNEIGSLNYCIMLKFNRHIGSTATDVPVKFQSNRKILNTNLAALKLREILKYILLDIETGPRILNQTGLVQMIQQSIFACL